MQPDGREHPARPDGRPGDTGRVLAWAPGFTDPETDPDTMALAGAIDPDATPDLDFADPDAFGELDLAATPVSVTPPRSWRRAAWFAVGASCVVLTVLVFAAARLAGPESPFDRLDAFPGPPTGGLLTAQPPGPAVPTGAGDPTVAGEHSDTVAGAATRTGTGDAPGQQNQPEGDGPGSGPAGSTGPGGAPVTSQVRTGEPTANPTVSLLPTIGSPPVTPEDMIDATRLFYESLPKDVDTAWGMVGPRVKVQGYETFRQQWADVTTVDLLRVVVNANDSSVLATVRTVTTEGAEHVDNFLLVFRQGNALTIEEIRPTGRDGNKTGG